MSVDEEPDAPTGSAELSAAKAERMRFVHMHFSFDEIPGMEYLGLPAPSRTEGNPDSTEDRPGDAAGPLP